MLLKTSKKSKRTLHRKKFGTSVLEAVAGMVLLAGTLAIGFDFVLLFIGYQSNSSICREAARNAAMTAPLRAEKNGEIGINSPSYVAAQEVIARRSQNANCWISCPVLTDVVLDGLKFNETPGIGSGISGFVTVSASTVISLPVVVHNVTPKSITVQSTFCYPITAVLEPSG
jgi:CRISPR/Cas system-associated exonuclease Cas4 (RecB family)